MNIVVDDKFKQFIAAKGVAKTAQKLKRRYIVVRDAALAAGIVIQRGRPREEGIAKRNQKIKQMRAKGLLLHEIAKRYNIGRERVRQILLETK